MEANFDEVEGDLGRRLGHSDVASADGKTSSGSDGRAAKSSDDGNIKRSERSSLIVPGAVASPLQCWSCDAVAQSVERHYKMSRVRATLQTWVRIPVEQ